jgi:site-specific DNA-methyltransferase (adenine-specific)
MYRLTDGIEFMKSLPDKSVDGIFSDPPWGIRETEPSIIQGNSDWLGLIKTMTDEALRVLKDDGRCLIWLGMRHVGPVIKVIDALEYRWMIFVSYMPPRYMATLESYLDPIIYFSPPGSPWPKQQNGNGKNKKQIFFKASTGKPDTAHPCARPYYQVKDILRQWFNEGDYVIDPFAGSDTTGVACRELNLKYDTCEIDPVMYETGLHRHKQQGLFEWAAPS